MLAKAETELIKRFKALLERRLHVHQVIVFGSRARGDANEGSDLDTLVVVEEPQDNNVLRFASECAFEVDLGSDVVISPIVVSRDDWENGPERSSLLALAIRREGIPI